MKTPEKIYAGPSKPNNANYTPYSNCLLCKQKGYKSYTRSDTVDKMRALLDEICNNISTYDNGLNYVSETLDAKRWQKETKDLLNKGD